MVRTSQVDVSVTTGATKTSSLFTLKGWVVARGFLVTVDNREEHWSCTGWTCLTGQLSLRTKASKLTLQRGQATWSLVANWAKTLRGPTIKGIELDGSIDRSSVKVGRLSTRLVSSSAGVQAIAEVIEVQGDRYEPRTYVVEP